MQMFQPGDKLRFAFKAPDKVGVISKAGQDDFDGHFATDN